MLSLSAMYGFCLRFQIVDSCYFVVMVIRWIYEDSISNEANVIQARIKRIDYTSEP